MLLLYIITTFLEEHRDRGLEKIVRKIKTHTKLRGNDLVDAAAKLAASDYDTLSTPDQAIRVEVGSIASAHSTGLCTKKPSPAPAIGFMHSPSHPPPSMVDEQGSGTSLNGCLYESV
jgi:hypothetical protein